jgi:hypothetical protein
MAHACTPETHRIEISLAQPGHSAMRPIRCWHALLFLSLLLPVPAATAPPLTPAAHAEQLSTPSANPDHTPEGYRQSLQSSVALVQACAASATACVAGRTSPDLLVHPKDAPTYAVHYGWLRAALEQARTEKSSQRAQTLSAASARLTQELAFLQQPAVNPQQAHAQINAASILQQKQFQYADSGPSWWQLLLSHISNWLDHLLLLAAMASAHRPWIGRLIEWTLLIAASAGLLAYALQVVRKDRALAARWVGPHATPAREPGVDWPALAQAAAAVGNWRAAVHAAYWAAIERLSREGRWEQQSAATTLRTPREYLRLLENGSRQREWLGTLTGLLERAWYAQRPTGERDYAQACDLAGMLGVADLAPALGASTASGRES